MPADQWAVMYRSLAPLRLEGGFGLVEVMVATMLIVMASLAALRVFDASASTSGTSRARTIAANLAHFLTPSSSPWRLLASNEVTGAGLGPLEAADGVDPPGD